MVLLRRQLPKILPELIRRIRKAPGGWEFAALKEVSAEVALLVNQSEVDKDKSAARLKVDPKSVRLKHSSVRLDEKYWRVEVWLEAPEDLMPQIEKVTYERHPTFRDRFKDVTAPPFEDTFRCWGEFTIKAEIKLKDGVHLKRQRYLSLEN